MTDVGLDQVIHAESRLRIMATLAGLPPGDEMAFPKLRKILGMTAGNLSTHLRKIEDAGYLTQSKVFEGRSPATYLQLTPAGRRAFEEYVENLRALLTSPPG